jgi:hypothetical protein
MPTEVVGRPTVWGSWVEAAHIQQLIGRFTSVELCGLGRETALVGLDVRRRRTDALACNSLIGNRCSMRAMDCRTMFAIYYINHAMKNALQKKKTRRGGEGWKNIGRLSNGRAVAFVTVCECLEVIL